MITTIRYRLMILKGNSTLKEFADRIGVPLSTVYYYLSGKREPSLSFLLKISEKLNVREEWLFTGKGQIFKDKNATLIDIDHIIDFLKSNWEHFSIEKKQCFETYLRKFFPEFELWLNLNHDGEKGY